MANSSNVCTIFSYFSILQLTSAFQTMLDWILDELLQKKHMIFHSATKEQGYRVTIIFFGRDVMGRIIDNCMMKYFATWILLAIASYTKLQLCLNSEMLKKQVAYLLMYCHEAMSIYDLFWPFLAHFWRFLHVQATQCKVINHCLVKAIIWWRMFLFVRRSDPIVSKNIQRSKLFNIV